jgi:cytoskeletal protein CcmA (bactofilin family)
VNVVGATVAIGGRADAVAIAAGVADIDAEIGDGLYVAAADIVFNGAVGGNLWAAGSTLSLTGQAARNVRLAGGTVSVGMTVAGDLNAVGGTIAVGPESVLRGRTWLAGARIAFEGTAEGRVTLAAGDVLFNGRAAGDVRLNAERATIGPNAVIGGNLILLSNAEADIMPGASVAGRILHEDTWTWFIGPRFDLWPVHVFLAVMAAGTAIVAGLGMLIFGAGAYVEAGHLARRSPLIGWIVGFAFVVLAPIVAIAFGLTILGLPLAFGIVLLVPLVLLLGFATAALGLADLALNWTGAPVSPWAAILLLIVGAVALAGIGLIPYVGPAIVFAVATLIGTGAFVRTLGRRLRSARALQP